MSEVNKLREFVYKVDGHYYVLGKNVYHECDNDVELINLFIEYEELTNDELFAKYTPIEMYEKRRREVGKKYQQIESECYKKYHDCVISDNNRAVFTKEQEDQIDLQIEKWKKAYECWQRSDNKGEVIY